MQCVRARIVRSKLKTAWIVLNKLSVKILMLTILMVRAQKQVQNIIDKSQTVLQKV